MTINKDEAIEAQKQYCDEHEAPFFAPLNGICWSCKKQIFNIIPVETARSSLITGCPNCHRSYCD